MKNFTKTFTLFVAVMSSACLEQPSPAGGTEETPPLCEDQTDYCKMEDGDERLNPNSGKFNFNGTTQLCDRDGDKALDLEVCEDKFPENRHDCEVVMVNGCPGYDPSFVDPNYCFRNCGASVGRGSSSGQVNISSSSSTGGSTGGTSSSVDICITNPFVCVGTSSSSSTGGTSNGNCSVNPFLCPGNGSTSGNAGSSSSSQMSSSSSSGSQTEWQFKDICGDRPAGQFAPARTVPGLPQCMDANLCTMRYAYDVHLCSVNAEPRWVGTGTGRAQNYQNGVSLTVVEQNASGVWARHCFSAPYLNQRQTGTLQCSESGYASLNEIYAAGNGNGFLEEGVGGNVRIFYTPIGDNGGAASSSSSTTGGTSSSQMTSSSSAATSSSSSTGGNNGGGGGNLGAIALFDRYESTEPGAVLFNPNYFYGENREGYRLATAKAVRLNQNYAGTQSNLEAVWSTSANLIIGLKWVPESQGINTLCLEESNNVVADFHRACVVNGDGGPSCYRKSNTDIWCSRIITTLVNGRLHSEPLVDSTQTGTILITAKAKAISSSPAECYPGTPDFNACMNVVGVSLSGINFMDFRQWEDIDNPSKPVRGLTVEYVETPLMPSEMYVMPPKQFVDAGAYWVVANRLHPFHIIRHNEDGTRNRMTTDYTAVPEDVNNTTFSCNLGFHYEPGYNCVANNRLWYTSEMAFQIDRDDAHPVLPRQPLPQ